jgi:zinc D-Ala-D-Ala dipeptidase
LTAYKKFLLYICFFISIALASFVGFKASAIIKDLKDELELIEHELTVLNEEKQTLIAELTKVNEIIAGNEFHDEDIDEVFQLCGLVEVRDIDSTIVVDLIYATDQNFTDQVLYNLEVCLLRRGTAEKLAEVNAEVAAKGYRIKVWDAFRPKSAQELMWEHTPDKKYVADPKEGSNHNRGASVDVTLVDQYGNELEMPTGFDVFNETASRSYPGMTEEARKNMDYLTEVMIKHGFRPIQPEWWHFNDEDLNQYDFLALTLEDWVNSYFAYTYSLER